MLAWRGAVILRPGNQMRGSGLHGASARSTSTVGGGASGRPRAPGASVTAPSLSPLSLRPKSLRCALTPELRNEHTGNPPNTRNASLFEKNQPVRVARPRETQNVVMSYTIRVQVPCPHCGEVRVPLAELRLVVESGHDAHYRFQCPSCEQTVARPADVHIQRVLARNEVEVTAPELAEELRDAGFEPDAVDDDEQSRHE